MSNTDKIQDNSDFESELKATLSNINPDLTTSSNAVEPPSLSGQTEENSIDDQPPDGNSDKPKITKPRKMVNITPLRGLKKIKCRCGFDEFTPDNSVRDDAPNRGKVLILKQAGLDVWLFPNGALQLQHEGRDPDEVEPNKAKVVLSNILKENVKIFTDNNPTFVPSDFKMAEDRFSPFARSTFYTIGRRLYRTAWKPTIYMQPQKVFIEPKVIKKLIRHLCNNNQEKYEWVINWLACFFQTLRKSQVALVFRGDQGSGKGILFNNIIAPLFGKKFCVVVDDDRLGTTFKSWIPEKLFYNLNEICADKKARKAVKNFLKMLITDGEINTEMKFKNSAIVEVFGNIIVTSNEPQVLEIETEDRRFIVIQTAKSLKKAGWDIPETLKAIKNELSGFAEYLRTYPTDFVLYDTAMDTIEKQALIESTNDRFKFFVSRLKDESTAIDYFNDLYEQHMDQEDFTGDIRETKEQRFSDDLVKSYENGFTGGNLVELFSLLNPTEELIGVRQLLKHLRSIDSIVFSSIKIPKKEAVEKRISYKSGGKDYFIIR